MRVSFFTIYTHYLTEELSKRYIPCPAHLPAYGPYEFFYTIIDMYVVISKQKKG